MQILQGCRRTDRQHKNRMLATLRVLSVKTNREQTTNYEYTDLKASKTIAGIITQSLCGIGDLSVVRTSPAYVGPWLATHSTSEHGYFSHTDTDVSQPIQHQWSRRLHATTPYAQSVYWVVHKKLGINILCRLKTDQLESFENDRINHNNEQLLSRSPEHLFDMISDHPSV